MKNLLLITLKLFDNNDEKINVNIAVEDNIDANGNKFKLIAFISHTGTSQEGHYTFTHLQNDGTWLMLDCDKQFINSDRSNAYVCLYQKFCSVNKSAVKFVEAVDIALEEKIQYQSQQITELKTQLDELLQERNTSDVTTIIKNRWKVGSREQSKKSDSSDTPTYNSHTEIAEKFKHFSQPRRQRREGNKSILKKSDLDEDKMHQYFVELVQ